MVFLLALHVTRLRQNWSYWFRKEFRQHVHVNDKTSTGNRGSRGFPRRAPVCPVAFLLAADAVMMVPSEMLVYQTIPVCTLVMQ